MEKWSTALIFILFGHFMSYTLFHLQKSSKTELNFERKWQKSCWNLTVDGVNWSKSSQSILPMTIFYDSNSYFFYAPNLFNPPGIDG